MAIQQLGIRLTLDGASTVTGGIGQVTRGLGTLDDEGIRVRGTLSNLGTVGSNAVAGLKNAVLGLVGVVSAAQLAREFVDVADTMTLLSARLKLTTASSDEYAAAQQAIYRIAQANNIGLQEATELFTKMQEPVKRLGGGINETSAIVDAFATSLRVGGARTQEASAATLQFAQAMASGKLQGDEFRSMAEASPRFMKALADGMDVPIERLKQMATDGQLTADVVGNALMKSLGQLRAEAASMPDTVSGAFQRMKNDVMLLVDEVNRAEGITSGLAETITLTNSFVLRIADAFRVWGAASRDTAGDLDLTGLGIRIIGTSLEAVIVLASDVAFVFRSMGREIGGIVAQFSALGEGGGIFSAEGRAAWTRVGEMIRDDAEKSRQELDRFQASVIGASERVLQQRDALKNSVVATSEMSAEVARLTGRLGEATLKTLENKTSTEQKKTAVDQAAKSTRDYIDQLDGQIAALNMQISVGRELTTGERDRLKLEEDVRSGKKKLTEAELESAKAKLAERDALELQWKSLKEQDAARRNAEKAAADYKAAVDNSVSALYSEVAAGRELTDTEKELIRIENLVRSGKMLLTEAEWASIRAKLAERDAVTEQIAKQREYEKTLISVFQHSSQLTGAQDDQNEALRKSNIELAEQIEKAGLSDRQIAAREASTLRAAAAELEWEAAMQGGNYRLEEQARLLRSRADLMERGVFVKEANDAAEAWKKTSESITQGLTDALMRGFENGKSFVENLVDYVRNRFKTMVAEYIVKPLMEPLGQAIASFMAPVRDAISGIMSGITGQISSYISQLTGISLGGGGSAAAGNPIGSAIGSAVGSAAGAVGTAILGSSAAYGAVIGSSSIAAGSQAAMLASQTGVFGAAGLSATAAAAAGAGGAGAGAAASGAAATGGSMLSAALPWVGALLAAYALFRRDKSGTPHMGASVTADASGASRTDGGALGFVVTPDDQMAQMLSILAGNLTSQLNENRAAAGKPRDVALELGFADDSSSDGAWGQLRLMVGGRTYAYWGSGDRWPGQGLANGEAGWRQFISLIDATIQSVFDAQMNPRDASVDLPEGGSGGGGSAGGGSTPSGQAFPSSVVGLGGVRRPVDPATGLVYQQHVGGDPMLGWRGGQLRVHNGIIYEGDLPAFGLSGDQTLRDLPSWAGPSLVRENEDRSSYVPAALEKPFARGGIFTNGLVTSPTTFPLGLMGEAGPEAIMPLSRGPDGSLGVNNWGALTRDEEMLAEMRALRTEMTNLRAEARATAENTGKTQRLMQRVTRDGESMQIVDVTPA